MRKILYTSSLLTLFFLGVFSNQIFAQGGTPPCPEEPFFAGSTWPNGCTIENVAPAGFFGQPIEYIWITTTANNGDCGASFPELLPLNVGELYNDFLAEGGFSGGASPVIGTTSWSFVTDDDADDLSLTLTELSVPTCFSRCARVVGCTSFYGEAAVTVQPCGLLPVELTRFNGNADGCNTYLSWSSSSEENFSHYELERSKDGRTFEFAESINGSGSLDGGHYYFKDDEADLENYYRLKMIDHDLSFEYSKIINVNSDCEIIEKITAYPNPVGDDFINVKVDSKREGEQLIKLVDVTGLEVYKENLMLREGINTFRLDVSELAGRIYFIKVGKRTLYRFAKTSQR